MNIVGTILVRFSLTVFMLKKFGRRNLEGGLSGKERISEMVKSFNINDVRRYRFLLKKKIN